MGENLRISRAFKLATEILGEVLKEIHYVLINSKSEQPQGLNARMNNNRKESNVICLKTPCLETAIHSRLYIRVTCCSGLRINKVSAKFGI
jgi:hypothetical protein